MSASHPCGYADFPLTASERNPKRKDMRIAIIENGNGSGTQDEAYRFALFREWESLGHEVSVLMLGNDRKTVGTARGRAGIFGVIRTLSRIFFGGFDIVFLRFFQVLPLLLPLRASRRLPGIVVSDVAPGRGFGMSLSRFLLPFLADRVAVSEASEEYADRESARRLVAPVLSEAMVVGAVSTTGWLRAFGLREGRYLLFAPRVVGREELILVVRAFRELEETGKLPNGFRLVIAGRFGFDAGTEPYLRSAIGERDSILSLGEQAGDARRELFSHAAISIQSSTDRDGLFEAMACGIPVVAPSSETNREYLGEAAWYFGDAAGLRDALSFLLVRPLEREGTGAAIRERFHERFSPEADAVRLLECFEDVIRERDSHRYQLKRTHRHA